MGNEQNVFEWRRFGHWKTSAEKARFSAFMLWHMSQDPRLSEVVRECAYSGGDADRAVLEAFRRESAVALELVVKAVIARKLEASLLIFNHIAGSIRFINSIEARIKGAGAGGSAASGDAIPFDLR